MNYFTVESVPQFMNKYHEGILSAEKSDLRLYMISVRMFDLPKSLTKTQYECK